MGTIYCQNNPQKWARFSSLQLNLPWPTPFLEDLCFKIFQSGLNNGFQLECHLVLCTFWFNMLKYHMQKVSVKPWMNPVWKSHSLSRRCFLYRFQLDWPFPHTTLLFLNHKGCSEFMLKCPTVCLWSIHFKVVQTTFVWTLCRYVLGFNLHF